MNTYKIVYKYGLVTFKLKFQADTDAEAKVRAKQFNAVSLGREVGRERTTNGVLLTKYKLLAGAPIW